MQVQRMIWGLCWHGGFEISITEPSAAWGLNLDFNWLNLCAPYYQLQVSSSMPRYTGFFAATRIG
jgi:hypothetical protein